MNQLIECPWCHHEIQIVRGRCPECHNPGEESRDAGNGAGSAIRQVMVVQACEPEFEKMK